MPSTALPQLSRRHLLATALGLAASGLLPGCGGGGRYAGRARIAVVGAGLAGLAAARSLSGTGQVTVYEAGGRPGGRLLTRRSGFLAKQVAELGADRFRADGLAAALAATLGLRTVDVGAGEQGLPTSLWSDGTAIDAAALPGRLAELDALAAGATATAPLLVSALAAAFGREPERIDPDHFAQGMTFGPPRGGLRVADGNDHLATALARGLAVRYGRRLESVRGGGPWVLSFAGDGGVEAVEADAIVLAVPLALIPTLDLPAMWNFAPALALADSGTHTRILLATATRPWREAGRSGAFLSDAGMFRRGWDATAGQAGDAGILCLEAAGAEARASVGAASSATAIAAIGQTARLFPGLGDITNINPLLHAWHQQPHALGSLPGFLPGGVALWRQTLDGLPAGIAFAGDHDVRTRAWGSEAALSSGTAAGARLAAFLT